MINVLVVDDHDSIHLGVAQFFSKSSSINLVDTAFSGHEALQKLKKGNIDVVVLDIGMPDMNGIECSREIKKLYPDIKIVAFTGETDPQVYYDIWMENVNALISKIDGLGVLASTIHDVYNGYTVIGDKIESFFDKRKSVKSTIKLTRREKEVLKLLASGMKRKDAAEQMFIGIETINTHCKNIFKKFDDNSISSVTAKAREAKLII